MPARNAATARSACSAGRVQTAPGSCLPLPQWLHLLAGVLLVLAPASASSAAVVRFSQSAAATRQMVYLGDVARITDANPQFVRQLEQVALTPAPPAGTRRPLDVSEVRSRLQSLGFDLSHIEFAGYGRVVLTGPARSAAGQATGTQQPARQVAHWQQDRADTAVEQAVLRMLHHRDPRLGRATVEVELRPEDIPLVLAAAGEIQVDGGQPPWDRPQQLAVRLRDRQGQEQVVPALVSVSPLPQVLVPRFNLPAGHVIRPEDLAWQQQERPSGPPPMPAELTGRETIRPLRRGQPIAARDVRPVPLIRRNDIVVVHSTFAGIRVSTEMKSRSTGAMGDRVLLVTLNGREQLAARVVGLQEAEVEPVDRAVASPAAPAGIGPARPVPHRPPASLSPPGPSRPDQSRPGQSLSGLSPPPQPARLPGQLPAATVRQGFLNSPMPTESNRQNPPVSGGLRNSPRGGFQP